MWNANPIFSMGDVTLQVLQSLLASFKDSRSAVEDLRTQLTKIVSDMNDQATRLCGNRDSRPYGRPSTFREIGQDAWDRSRTGGEAHCDL